MSIPQIPPYRLSDVEAGASPMLDWRIDPGRAVLLIHDMQNYFVDAYRAGEEPMSSVIPNIATLREAATDSGIPVIYSAQPPRQHPSRRGLLTQRWGTGISDDSQARVIDQLAPGASDITVVKWRYSAFARTDLRALLAHAGRDQLLITGIYAHIGCMLTAADAFMNDIQAFLVTDGIADFDATSHARAIDYVSTTCGVPTTTREARDAIIGVRAHA